jgi:hypothetical protein
MAFTFRGVGAMHYGERDYRSDGSHLTTLWFVLFYVPIIPIHTKRIRVTGEVKYYALRPSRTLILLEKTKPDLTQVISAYAWFAAGLAIFITAKIHANWWIAVPGILLLGLPWVLRRRARERMALQSERAAMGFSPEISD